MASQDVRVQLHALLVSHLASAIDDTVKLARRYACLLAQNCATLRNAQAK
jgi:hypothetical protein